MRICAKALLLTHAGEKRLQAGVKAWANAPSQFEATFGAKRAGELRGMLRGRRQRIHSESSAKGRAAKSALAGCAPKLDLSLPDLIRLDPAIHAADQPWTTGS